MSKAGVKNIYSSNKVRETLFTSARFGIKDIIEGFKHWRICYLMGSAEMRQRYARSKLGQLWIVLSSAIMISSIGLVWSYIWRQPVDKILPYIAISLISWQMISNTITVATTILISKRNYFLNQYIPASVVIISLLYQNFLTFIFNIIYPLIIAFSFGENISADLLLIFPALFMFLISCFWMSYVIAILCSRFHDISQIVSSLFSVLVYITPVLWRPEQLPENVQSILFFNPFAVLLSIIRDPLLDRPVPANYWYAALILSFGGLVISLPFIGRYHRRLIFWL